MSDDALISIPEAAHRLHVHVDTVRRAIRRGELPARKLWGRWKIAVSDLDAIGSRRVAGAAAVEKAGSRG